MTFADNTTLFESNFYDEPPTQWHPDTLAQQKDELARISSICEMSDVCIDNAMSEPTWNTRVHSPLLELALESFFGSPSTTSRCRRRENTVCFMDATRLGDTQTVRGCYQITSALRRLARRMAEEYQPWLEEYVFHIP